MATYTYDGHVIEADSAAELVTKMREASLAGTDDNRTFMKQMAERAIIMWGEELDADSEQHFVDGLIKFGMLEQGSPAIQDAPDDEPIPTDPDMESDDD